MICPNCGKNDNSVIDSRLSRGGAAIRRRRLCHSCRFRFTTYEEATRDDLKVEKRSGALESFSREKIERGVRRACEKRNISDEQIGLIIDNVICSLEGKSPIPTAKIGEAVMSELYKIDQVAYIRFASVYRHFKDVSEFADALRQMEHDHLTELSEEEEDSQI